MKDTKKKRNETKAKSGTHCSGCRIERKSWSYWKQLERDQHTHTAHSHMPGLQHGLTVSTVNHPEPKRPTSKAAAQEPDGRTDAGRGPRQLPSEVRFDSGSGCVIYFTCHLVTTVHRRSASSPLQVPRSLAYTTAQRHARRSPWMGRDLFTGPRTRQPASERTIDDDFQRRKREKGGALSVVAGGWWFSVGFR